MQFKKFSLTFYKNEEIIHEDIYNNLDSVNNSFRLNMLDYETYLNIEDKIFTRENEDFKFVLDILNKKCTIHLKKEDMSLNINVDLCELNIVNNKIILEYIIESDDAKNKIVIKEEKC